MAVLVTGGSGYIARHVIRLLQQQGYQVRATVRSLKNEEKVKPLYDLCPEAKYPLELVEADLSDAASWVEAVRGCTYVQHLASPFPLSNPANEDEVIRPAVDGTLHVLHACQQAGGVRRVVLTSSIAAINASFDVRAEPWTEEDWSDFKSPNLNTYMKSKTLAEQAAWQFMRGERQEGQEGQVTAPDFELAVVNPGFVVGPLLGSGISSSVEIPRRIMVRDMPALPRMGMPMVDVRDVASAHVSAMTVPEAAGKRHIIVTESLFAKDVAGMLDEEFRPQGYRPVTTEAPNIVVKFLSIFDKEIRQITPGLGQVAKYDTSRMRSVLGITPRKVNDSYTDMVYSMIEAGHLKKTAKYTGPRYSE